MAPLRSGGEVVGTLWALTHTRERKFDTEDARLLESLAQFAGASFRLTASLKAEREAHTALKQFSENLESRFETALAEKKIFADVLARSQGAVTVLSTDFKILAINPTNIDAFERAFGKRPKVGDDFLQLFDDVAEVRRQQQAIWRRALDGETFVVTDEFGFEDRERRYYEVRFSPLLDRQGVRIGASSTSYDVTDRLRAEAQLAAAQEQLRQAQKMEAVGQLTGGLAHDFNNLLAVISVSHQLVRRRIRAGAIDGLEQLVAGADRSVQRAAALTHRMLAFSRQQVLDVRQVDANALALGMEELMRSTLGEHVVLEMALERDLWLALTDANQLENALLNLAINSRDAMPDGGTLTIETECMHVGPGGVPGTTNLGVGDYIVISVSDTGTGMSPEVVAKAFDPFFTTKAAGRGSGLGLAMIHGFAKQAGGDAFIYSRVGEGTTVKLFLPRAKGHEAGIAAPTTNVPTLRGTGERILVVDDQDDLRVALAAALADLGYRPIEAGDAKTALTLLATDQTFHLLLSDIGLPDMSGRVLADKAREMRPQLKVLFMSGYAKGAMVRGDIVRDGMDMLFKPFSMDVLADKVRAMTLPDSGERRRLLDLYALDILDTPEEQAFDDLVRMAASLCGVPTALISLVDADRQWFKARVGMDAKETPRDLAFCAHAINAPDEIMVVQDATADPRFAANPLVTGDPNIRFYAGAPLVTPSGEAIGTLCVIDKVPRAVSGEQLEELRFLAQQVVMKLEERRAKLG